MAYIGREPTNGIFAKQTLSTDGSTVTFTLDFAVADESSLLVSVGGVLQEPKVAYNLAGGGTQITFTAAPASTDTAYIQYLGQAVVQNLTDLNGVALVLDADADTTIAADTDDQIDIQIAGADDFQFTANKFSVLSGSAQSFADSSKALFGASDDLEIYHDGTNSLIANKTGALKIATETSGIAVTIGHTTSETTVADNLTVTGNLTVGGTTSFGDFDITNVGSIALDTITNDGTDITLDSSADIVIDAAGGNVEFKDAGTTQLTLDMDGTAGAQVIQLRVDSDDLVFKQFDGTTILTLNDNLVVDVASTLNVGDDLSLVSDAAVLNFGADSEIKLTHVADTGLLLTDSGGSPTLQLHDANESVSSDGSKLILTSNGVAFSLPTADGSNGQALVTNGSGVISFTTLSANTPSSADGQALGSASLEWSDLFLADGGTIQLGNDQDVTITHVADSGITMNAASASKLTVRSADGTSASVKLQRVNEDDASTDFELKNDGGLFKIIGDNNSQNEREIARFETASITFNDGSEDIDFRIESNGNANMFFVDGGNDHVNVGTSTDHGAVMNIESSDNALTLCLASTDTDANVGPQLKLFRAVTGADNDVCGNIEFGAKDDAGNTEAYALIRQTILDASHGSEEGKLSFLNMEGGSQREVLTLAASEVVINEDSRDVDFRVETDGDANALFVEGSSNNVGIGNNNPGTKLSVGDDDAGSVGTTAKIVTISQDGSTTFDGGNVGTIFGMNIMNNDETSNRTGSGITFGHRSSSSGIAYIASTSTSADRGDFRIGTRGSGGIHEVVRVTDDGNFQVSRNGAALNANSSHQFVDDLANSYSLMLSNKANNPASQYMLEIGFKSSSPDNNSARFVQCLDSTTIRAEIMSDGDLRNHDNSYGSTSDERIKQDIVDAGSQWADIKAFKVRKFKKKDDVRQYGAENAKVQIGVIAQELETVSPGLIKEQEPGISDIQSSSEFGALYTSDDNETKDGNDAVLYTQEEVNADVYPEGHPDAGDRIGTFSAGDIKIEATHSKKVGDIKTISANVKSVNYSVLYMKAIKALQEAQTRIETLESKVQALEDA